MHEAILRWPTLNRDLSSLGAVFNHPTCCKKMGLHGHPITHPRALISSSLTGAFPTSQCRPWQRDTWVQSPGDTHGRPWVKVRGHQAQAICREMALTLHTGLHGCSTPEDQHGRVNA